jgi:hypothetical protein
MKHLKLILLILLGLFLLPEAQAQTNSDPTQTICFGSVKDYRVDWQLPDPLTGTIGSTYDWTLSPAVTGPGLATITTGDGTNFITVDWGTTPAGTYVNALSVIETTSSGCIGTVVNLTVIITPLIVPSFTTLGPLCQNTTAPLLPTISNDSPAITGSWDAILSTATAGTVIYNFTPTAGQCATTTTMSVVVTPEITPTFTTLGPLCQNSIAPVLPLNSTNSPVISGTWDAILSTATAGTVIYNFTPTAGQCAIPTTMSVLVNPEITPTFTPLGPLCQNSLAPVLPLSSTNSPAISGTWDAILSTASAGTVIYNFTPTAGQCAIPTTMSVTVNPTPTISIAAGPTCSADLLSWSVDVTVSAGTLTSSEGTVVNTSGNNWTVSAIPAGTPTLLTVTALGCPGTLPVSAPNCNCPTVTQPVGTGAAYCFGTTPVPAITALVLPGQTLNWYDAPTGGTLVGTGSPFSPAAPGTYYAEAVDNTTLCVSQRTPVTLTENALPPVTVSADVAICEGQDTDLTASGASTYSWDNAGSLSSATGTTVTATPIVTTTYTVTGTALNGCEDTATVTVTVTPTPNTSPIFHD